MTKWWRIEEFRNGCARCSVSGDEIWYVWHYLWMCMSFFRHLEETNQILKISSLVLNVFGWHCAALSAATSIKKNNFTWHHRHEAKQIGQVLALIADAAEKSVDRERESHCWESLISKPSHKRSNGKGRVLTTALLITRRCGLKFCLFFSFISRVDRLLIYSAPAASETVFNSRFTLG
jgi:hypothetical protein